MYKKIFLFLMISSNSLAFAESTEPVKTQANSTKLVVQSEPKVTEEKIKATGKEEADLKEEAIVKTAVRTGHADTPETETNTELSTQLTQETKQKILSEVTKKKTATAPAEASATSAAAEKKVADANPILESLNKEQKLLMMENIVKEERLKKKNSALRMQLQQLRWEKDVLNAQLDVEALREETKNKAINKQHQSQLLTLTREVEIAEEQGRILTSNLETQRLKSELKTANFESEIAGFHIEKERKKYADKKPIHLDNPLVDDGQTLIISDRRIEMNGLIAPETGEFVLKRINFYNNKDSKKPIFLVIDSSPGGSAMAGYQIMKAIQSSKAPVYVVVKSLAASMAAIITTLADHSFAYPNTIIVHHQLAINLFLARLNITQQKEMYEDSKKWWDRMMGPVATKMGITNDEFIIQMYKKSSSGDWSEFGTEAQKLKWVNTIIQRIEETSFIKDPDAENEAEEDMSHEELSAKGHAVHYLPHLLPKDAYFIYNPDQYYQIR